MKRILQSVVAALLLLTLNHLVSTASAQGTAFTYQGQLQNNGSPASGTYNLQFTLYTTNGGVGSIVGGPVTSSGVLVTNGLFTVTIDFGASPWNGQTNWLQIGVESNGIGSFTPLTPRQRLTPTPYAIFAEGANAAGLTGTVLDSQLASSSVTVTAGTGLSGGGPVALGGSTTLNNAGVTSLAGGDGVTVSAASGPVTLGLGSTISLPSVPVTITAAEVRLLYADNNYNFTAGYPAANFAGSAFDDTAIGGEALTYNTSGSYNTAAGSGALFSNTNGSGNTAIGTIALFYNTSGSDNTASGFQALFLNTTGYGNTANGWAALDANTSGTYNTASGYQALSNNINGSYNTASGYNALASNTNGSQNTALGATALFYNTSGYNNTASGYQALLGNTSGYYNTASGAEALLGNTRGYYNTASGAEALYYNVSGADNTAIGYSALYFLGYSTGGGGNNNIALGYYAGANFFSNESDNIDIGNEGQTGENNTIRIGTPGTQTSAVIAGVVNDNGGVSVGASGTTILNLETGQAVMPSASTVETNFTITFPTAFSSSPKIIFTLANDPGFQGYSDVFASSVSSNSPAAFTVNVYRVNGTGWLQNLRINWQAWQ
jgi:hypothetical protein